MYFDFTIRLKCESLFSFIFLVCFDNFDIYLFQKHSTLTNWQAYLEMIEEIRRMSTSGVTKGRREIVLRGRKHLSPLDASNFFLTYPSFETIRLEIDRNINFLIHNTKKYLYRSVLSYFELLFPGQEVKLKDKAEGSVGIHVCFCSLLCYVILLMFFSLVYS